MFPFVLGLGENERIYPLLSFFVNDSLRRLVPLLLTASLIGKSIVSSDHKEARRVSLKNVKNMRNTCRRSAI